MKYRRSLRVKLIIGIAAVLLIALMFPKGESIESEVAVGSIWIHDDLIAPFSFPILKDPEAYKAQAKAAKGNIYPIYLKMVNTGKRALDSLKNYDKFLIICIESSLKKEDSTGLNPTFLSHESFKSFHNFAKEDKQNSIPNIFTRQIFLPAEEILESIYHGNIIDTTQMPSLHDSIAIRTGNVDQIENITDIKNINSMQVQARNGISKFPFTPEIKKAISEYINHFIFANVIFSKDLTKEETNQAVSNVSRYSGIVNENERIIAKHDRITKEAKLKIDSYKAAKGDRVGSEGNLLQFLGKVLHISSLLTLLVIYLFLFRKKIFHDNIKILLMALNFIFISFIAYMINQVSVDFPLQFLIFVPVSSMLMTIIFDSRVGFYCTVITVLILGALRSNDYTFAAMNLFAGVLSVYSVRDIKNRSQIFRSFLFVLTGYLITILAFGLERFAPLNQLLIESAFAGTNAIISPVLTYGLLIFFEKIFKITTDLTLVELSNFDLPLLKDLARRAPGTFNHSMTMGTLAEAAAESIKANPLLARVGAYYHDIGKTIMPQNFVENQLNNLNVHENLSPEESVSLIVKHVKEGIVLGEEYRLPKEIIDFIPMHHGTTVISYFYDKAKRLYGEEKVNIDDYRYPGPKPNSKETVIVMLADGCESAVRSIEDPDPLKVENVIGHIIQTRIDENQLDDAPITFYDLTRIKDSFTSILVGQRHHRIRYPKQDELEKSADEKLE
ncbi:MAG: HD family phosphohydrolase [Ignavibacteriaceae bacterium]